ncbi:MAG: glycoside hydrolase family 65 protein [Kiritimatiellae bacterium]|nr:glycoside hydrolase family 65 protein [Kiritimatiellia bacterium]
MNKTSTTASPWYVSGDPWVLTQDGWDAERSHYFETIFSQSNGYMGIRGYREEFDTAGRSIREGYLAGVFANLPPVARELVIHDYEWNSRQMVSLPELFSTWIVLDGGAFCLTSGELKQYRQSLDMRNGVLSREVVWSDGWRTTRIRFSRFLSAANPHLAVQKIEIEPLDWSGVAELFWDYDLSQKTIFRCGDPAKAQVPCAHFAVMEAQAEENGASGLVETDGTGHRIAFASRLLGRGATSTASLAGTISQLGKAKVSKGKVSTWVRISAVVTSRDKGVRNPATKAKSLLDAAGKAGFNRLLAAHSRVWAARWKDADIQLEGSKHDQALIRFSLFSLLQIAPFHADTVSVPARCYAYNRYNGLYFWDGEIFLLPFYQFCTPGVARNLLQFRCRTLPGARRNAKLLGGKGAMFPWQGDADEGLEQAPWYLYRFLWHQNADIVYAFDQYARATGDDAFMCKEGLEVLAETARFWVSVLKQDAKGLFHLECTVGPDESDDHGPDNGYTSLMARRSLEISQHWWTVAARKNPARRSKMANALGVTDQEIASWAKVAEKICIPEVPDLPGVPLQDAAFLKKKPVDISGMTVADFWKLRGKVQVIKQADIVLAMYLCEDEFTREEIQRGYEYYEPKTLHVSSLSLNTHAIVAAIIGHKQEAYDYFRQAAGLDLDNFRNATKDGLHAAALGAVWQMTIPGFMGLRVREDHLYFQPAPPKTWRKIRFPLQYRGWRLDCTAGNGKLRIKVSGKGEKGAVVKIGETVRTLAAGKTIALPY